MVKRRTEPTLRPSGRETRPTTLRPGWAEVPSLLRGWKPSTAGASAAGAGFLAAAGSGRLTEGGSVA